METPRVSVIMAVHNGERFLAEAVESILHQTYPHFEFLIINDASTDQTRAMLSHYAAQDQRVRIIDNLQNLGLTRSLNIGLRAACGDYIARQDADDIAIAERFAIQVAYLDEHPQTVLLGSYFDMINEHGQVINTVRRDADPLLIAWGMLFYNHIAGHSQVMFRREAALDGYNEERRYSQDYELWLRLLDRGDIAIIPQVLQQWRQHGSNISVQRAQEQAHLSLMDSQQALYKLTGQQLDLEEIARLRGFWVKPFPDYAYAGQIHARLQEIYRAFMAAQPSGDAIKLRHYIGERFILWTRSNDLYRQWGKKLQVGRYAAYWHPIGLLKNWSGWRANR